MGTIYYMNDQSNSERRRYTRIPFNRNVTLYSGMEALEAEIIDISLKGVLLKCPENHQPQSGGLYRLSIPIDSAPAIIMNIEVIHANEKVFGAEWTQIDMDSFASLKRTIELNINEEDNLRKDIKTLAE